MANKVYDVITSKIIEQLEKGVVPWHKPWGSGGWPKNFKSGKEYRGINIFILGTSPYMSPYWLTYKQAQEMGGQVRKGEKGFPIVFWKEWKTEDKDTGEEVKIPVLRYYTGFNAQQIDGIDFPQPGKQRENHDPIPECEGIVAGMPNRPKILNGGDRCCYVPVLDHVEMPEPEWFGRDVDYYAALFHELTHSTGHENRLNRRPSRVVRNFGDKEYSYEELVAEMGSAFLCGESGIIDRTVDNSASYINGWLKILRKDSKMVVVAAGQAQKAADYILDRRK